MTDESLPEERMIVTISPSSDPASDAWLVTGPYWEPGGTDAAAGAQSYIITGEAEAMDFAEGQVELVHGTKLVVHPKSPRTVN